MHMQRHGIDFKTGFFGFAGPIQVRRLHLLQGFQRGTHAVLIAALQGIVYQLFHRRPTAIELQGRINMRVILPLLFLFDAVGFRRNQADRRVIFALVVVLISGDFLGHSHPWRF
jgi:hypothetical protein